MYGKALREVYEVLDNMSFEDTQLISSAFLRRLYNSADWSYNFKYDLNKSFSEQNLSEDAKCILAIIYIRYFASAEEKREIMKMISEN